MNKEWLITLEDVWYTITIYYTTGDGKYLNERIEKGQPNTTMSYASNSQLVEDVCLQVRGRHRVKEMPYKYGKFWRDIFEQKGIVNWSTNTP